MAQGFTRDPGLLDPLGVELVTGAWRFNTIELQTANKTITVAQALINADTTVTYNAADIGASGINLSPTIQWSQNQAGSLNVWYGFLNNPILQNSGNFTPGPISNFVDDATLHTITNTLTWPELTSFRAHPTVTIATGGVANITEINMFRGQLRAVPTGSTVTLLRGFEYEDESGGLWAGTVTTQVAVDIPALIGATNNIGIRTAALVQVNSGADIDLYSDAATTLTGRWDSATGQITLFGGGLKLSGGLALTENTSDASDTSFLQIGGGGAAGVTRGATITVYGNEHASFPGGLFCNAGNVTGSFFAVQTAATTRYQINFAGGALFGHYMRVGDAFNAPTAVTNGDLTCIRLNVGNIAFGSGVESVLGGDATLSGFLRVGSNTAPTNVTAGDLEASRLLVGTDAAFPSGGVLLWVNQPTLGNEVMRLTSTATNDDPAEMVYQNWTTTTNATTTTIHTITIPASTTVMVEYRVVARRTGGAAGTAEDGATYYALDSFKNVAGTATRISGSFNTLYSTESQAGWVIASSPSGADVQLRVTGALNNDIVWHATIRVWQVGS